MARNDMRKTGNVPVVPIALPAGWEILRNTLRDLDPTSADQVTVNVGTVWQMMFHEDLLWAVNRNRSLVLDVGWYPDSDPTGSYFVDLRKLVSPSIPDSPRDGRHATVLGGFIERFETRSLAEVVCAITRLAIMHGTQG
jgi:hypothetical protein